MAIHIDPGTGLLDVVRNRDAGLHAGLKARGRVEGDELGRAKIGALEQAQNALADEDRRICAGNLRSRLLRRDRLETGVFEAPAVQPRVLEVVTVLPLTDQARWSLALLILSSEATSESSRTSVVAVEEAQRGASTSRTEDAEAPSTEDETEMTSVALVTVAEVVGM